MSALETAPFVNTRQLEQIYTSVTDTKIWKQSEIINTLGTMKRNKY